MANNVHDIIKSERKKRGISPMFWSREMARLAQSQANYCAKVGRMVHSDRYAFQGGENLAQGGNNFTPRAIVDCWLRSNAGHREYLLSPKVTKSGVGIAKGRGKTFVAWAFSDAPPSYPDCSSYRERRDRKITVSRLPHIKFRRKTMLRILVGLFGLWLVILGAHGLFTYFSAWDALWSGSLVTADKLFFVIRVPPPLSDWVYWMSNQGLRSWFLPLVVGAGGLVIMSRTEFTDTLLNWLRRKRLL